MSFTLYVVFHKFLVPECYETLSGEDLKYLRFMAVNAKIPKEVPDFLASQVIEERRLAWYNPFLQHNRFCESSAFFHVWKNAQLMNDYIGFFHYDMLIEKPAIEFPNSLSLSKYSTTMDRPRCGFQYKIVGGRSILSAKI